jgi:hypothetical protein
MFEMTKLVSTHLSSRSSQGVRLVLGRAWCEMREVPSCSVPQFNEHPPVPERPRFR